MRSELSAYRFRIKGAIERMIGSLKASEVRDVMTEFQGEFWSRKYGSDTDVSAQLSGSQIDTPLKNAFVDACMAVEDPDNLAEVEISLTPESDFRLEAKGKLGSCAIVTTKCPRCSAAVHGRHHPFNGCEAVVVEEIMIQ